MQWKNEDHNAAPDFLLNIEKIHYTGLKKGEKENHRLHNKNLSQIELSVEFKILIDAIKITYMLIDANKDLR